MSRPVARIEAGWVGVRGYGRRLWESVVSLPNFRVSGCYHSAPDVRAEAAERMRCAAFSSYEKLLNSSCNTIILTVPNQWHFPYAKAALLKGKHVYVEKPLTESLDQARELVALARRRRLTLAVGHNHRYNEFIREMKRRIDRGAIGRIVMAEMNMSHGGALGFTPRQWRYHRSQCPGGPLSMLGSHLIDTANYLFGDPLMASGWLEKRFAPTTAPDSAAIAVRYAGGVRVQIVTLYNSVSTETISVYGTRGALRFTRWPKMQLVLQPLDVNRQAAPYRSMAFKKNDSGRAAFSDFLRSIAAGRQPQVSGRQGLKVVEVIDWVRHPHGH